MANVPGIYIYGPAEKFEGAGVGENISVSIGDNTFSGEYKGNAVAQGTALMYGVAIDKSVVVGTNQTSYIYDCSSSELLLANAGGRYEIVNTEFTTVGNALWLRGETDVITSVCDSTFNSGSNIYVENNRILEFSGTNNICGNIATGGTGGQFILTENAQLVFGNSEAISVADLTFNGNNTLKFTGTGRVTFAATETFTDVTLQNGDGKTVAVKTGLTIYGSDVNLTNVYLPDLDIIASGTGKGGLSTSISGSNLLLMNQNVSVTSTSTSGDLYIYNSHIEFNALCHYYGKGFYRGGGTTVISGSTFSMSPTLQDELGANGAFGFVSGGNVVIKDSLFIGNKANSGEGGAFGSSNAGAVIAVSGSTFAKQYDTVCVRSGSELTFEKTNYFNASIFGAGTYTMADNAKLVFGNSGYDITVVALNFGNDNNITLAGTGKVGFTNTSDFSGVSITVDASKLDVYTLSYTLATGLDSANIDKITIINDVNNTWKKSLSGGTLSLTNTNENIITVTNIYGPAENFGNVEVGTAVKGFSSEGCDYIFNGTYKGDIKSGDPQNSLLYKTTISGSVYSNSKVYILDSVVTGSENGVRSHDGSTITICNTLFYGNTSYSFWAREANSFGILSGSTFCDKIYAEKGSITFQDTNYISAAISKAADGKITLADNAKLVFGNSEAISVADLTFSSGNTITLGSGKVTFAANENLSGVTVKVDVEKFNIATQSYTVAGNVAGVEEKDIEILNNSNNLWKAELNNGTLTVKNQATVVGSIYGPAENFGNAEAGAGVSFATESGKIFAGTYQGEIFSGTHGDNLLFYKTVHNGLLSTNSSLYFYETTVKDGANGIKLNKAGKAEIVATLFTGHTANALWLDVEGTEATVSNSTFATAGDVIYNRLGTVTFKNTNYINAALTGSGSYIMADGAELVFGNESEVNVAALTVDGSAAFTFNGALVRFSNLDLSQISGVTITVSADLIPAADSYTLASGIILAENQSITVGSQQYLLNSEFEYNGKKYVFQNIGNTLTVGEKIITYDQVYVGFDGDGENYFTDALTAGKHLSKNGTMYIKNTFSQNESADYSNYHYALGKGEIVNGSLDIVLENEQNSDNRYFALGNVAGSKYGNSEVSGDLNFTASGSNVYSISLYGAANPKAFAQNAEMIIQNSVISSVNGGGSGKAGYIAGNLTITVSQSEIGNIIASYGDEIKGEVVINLNNAAVGTLRKGNIDKKMTLTVSGGLSTLGTISDVDVLVVEKDSSLKFNTVTDLSNIAITVDGTGLEAGDVIATGVTGTLGDDDTIVNGKENLSLAVMNGDLVLKKDTALSGSLFVGSDCNYITDGEIKGTLYSTTSYSSAIYTTLASGTIGQYMLGGLWAKGAVENAVEKVAVTITGGLVKGSAYAGGYSAGTNDATTRSAEALMTVIESNLDLAGGEVKGDIYGGIHACKHGFGKVETVNITISGGIHNNIFGGGWAEQIATSVVDTVNITVSTGSTVDMLFAGGGASLQNTENLSTVGTSTIEISGGDVNKIYLSGLNNRTQITGSAALTVSQANSFELITGLDYTGTDSNSGKTSVAIKADVFCSEMVEIDELTIAEGCKLTFGSASGIDCVKFDIAGDVEWTALSSDNLATAFDSTTLFKIGDVEYIGWDNLIASDIADLSEDNKSLILNGKLA